MGTYQLNTEEIVDDFRKFLQSLEGEFDAKDIMEAYNKIAKEEGWVDRITAVKQKAKED